MKGGINMAFTIKQVGQEIAKQEKAKDMAQQKVEPLLQQIKDCEKKINKLQELKQKLEKLEADFSEVV